MGAEISGKQLSWGRTDKRCRYLLSEIYRVQYLQRKPKLPGLPHSFSRNGDTETLILYLHDERAGVLAEVCCIRCFRTVMSFYIPKCRIQESGEKLSGHAPESAFFLYLSDGSSENFSLEQHKKPGTSAPEKCWPSAMEYEENIGSKGAVLHMNAQSFFALLSVQDTTENQG